MENEQKREILELLSELPQSEKRDKAIQTVNYTHLKEGA